jgi:hypothetical protein
MKTFVLFPFLFLAFLSMGFAQQYTHEFGQNSGDEFSLKTVPFDTAAQAVVIYDIGKTSFLQDDLGFKIFYERKVKIKILKPGGLAFAEFHIPYYSEGSKTEVVSDIAGNTYNMENGAVRTSSFDPKNIYTEKEEDHVKEIRFALPDVKEGSVIEVKYSVLSPFHSSFHAWLFQAIIPVLYSEYSTILNPIIEYRYMLQGAKDFDVFKETAYPGVKQFHGDNYTEKELFFAMKNIAAFKEETRMPAVKDYIIKLDFRLVRYNYPATGSGVIEINSGWPVIADNLMESDRFGKYLKACQHKAKAITDGLNLKGLSQRQIAEKIENYVKANFKWNETYGIYISSKNYADFLNVKTGSCADLNLLLVGMLNCAGIEAYPLLVSTRKHGKIKPTFPAAGNFNYVLAYVKTDSLRLILDATNPLADFREIPIPCLNEMGFIVKNGKEPGWIKFNSTVSSFITHQVDFVPDPDKGEITGDFQITADGYDALALRTLYLRDPLDMKKKLNIASYTYLDSLTIENAKQPQNDLQVHFKAEVNLVGDKKSPMEKVEKRLLLHPFLDLDIAENPFVEPTRNFPIVFDNRFKRQYYSTIHIPEGYSVSSKPENLRIDNENVLIEYSTSLTNDNTIKVSGIFELKKDRYEASAYTDIKDFFTTITEKFNEQIVFVKP